MARRFQNLVDALLLGTRELSGDGRLGDAATANDCARAVADGTLDRRSRVARRANGGLSARGSRGAKRCRKRAQLLACRGNHILQRRPAIVRCTRQAILAAGGQPTRCRGGAPVRFGRRWGRIGR